MLCIVVQELHQCLALLIEEDSLLNLEMLDVVEKDPMAPAPASTASYPTPYPKEEKQIIQIPKEPCTSKPEEASHWEGGLDLVQGRYPAIPLGFTHTQVNQTHADLAKGIPLGTQLSLCSLGSLWVTISHGPAVGKMCYEYQSQMITQALLQLPLFEPSKPSDSPPRIQKLCANTTFFLSLMSDPTTPWPQKNCQRLFSVHPEGNGTLSLVTL